MAEWKVATESPGTRKRFIHFGKCSEERDPSVKFKAIEEQKKVADWK